MVDRSRTVLLATPAFDRDGGVGAHVTKSAAALRDSGFDVSVVAGRGDPELCRGIGFRELPDLDRDSISADCRGQVLALVRELRPGTVHFHDLADAGLMSAAQQEAPTVASVHGYAGCTPNTYYFSPGDECHRAHGPGCVANMALRGCAHTKDPRGLVRRYRATTRRVEALRRVDQVIAYSQAVARHLHRNGIDRCAVVPLFARLAEAVVPPPSERRVMFAGRVVAAKGLGTLLKAARGLECTIEVHGDGWWLPQARALAARHGIADRVVFNGWSDEQALARAYDRCRLVAVPSLWPEPFGLVGIEAMAHGRAVVASDTGGVREWLVDGETGSLVAPGDAVALRGALHRLLDDHELCVRMGRTGAERVAQLFSAAAHAESLERVYRDARARWSERR